MDNIRIGFSLGKMYDFPVVHVILRMLLYGVTKEKVYIPAGTELGENLCEKNLFMNNSLYGLKPSAARFH
jgi:hypothetical protein